MSLFQLSKFLLISYILLLIFLNLLLIFLNAFLKLHLFLFSTLLVQFSI